MIEETFTALGTIILIGFFGRAAFRRTRIPESLFLVVVGLLIGPILNLVRADLFLPFVPFISVLALVLVLLDAGLGLNVFRVIRGFGLALAFTLIVAIMVTSLVGAALHLFLGWELLHALLIGLISSGTTTVAAMGLLELMKIGQKTKGFLFLETVINDFILIFGTSVILLFISGKGSMDGIPATLVSSVSIATALGLALGILWIRVLKRIGFERFSYIASVGALFLIYGMTEAVGGDGIIATLVFSLVLGNYANIYKRFAPENKSVTLNKERQIIREIRAVHGDISFVVRIFFFVLIGVILRFESLTPEILGTSALIIALIVIGRILGFIIVSRMDRDIAKNGAVIITMIPRGFVATVLAFIPLGMNISIPGLTEIVLVLILATNVIAMAATFFNASIAGKGGAGKGR